MFDVLLQCPDGGHKLITTVLVGLEEIEGRAARREKDGIAFVRGVISRLHGVVQIVRVDNGYWLLAIGY